MAERMIRPSEARPGMRIGTEHKLYYYVLSEPAEQPDGKWVLMVRYPDSGRGLREWDDDSPTLPQWTA